MMNNNQNRRIPSPNLFGPPAWKFLHYIAYGYPEVASPALQSKTLQFFESLPYLLPCEACGEHLYENLKNSNIVLNEAVKTREGMINYMNNLHNIVNQQLGKPTMSRQESESALFNDNNCYNVFVMIVIFIIGIGLGMIITKKFF